MPSAAIVPIIPRIKLKRILLATDFSTGSSTALPIVATLSRRYNAEVIISHIWSPMPYTMATPETVSTLEKQLEEFARQKLSEFLKTAGTLGISPRALVRSGDPLEEIDQIVREQAIDLTVISTHGRVGFRHLAMGSVAEALFRNLACPVLTVGPHLAHRFLGDVNIENILFPTDLSVESQSVFAYLASLADEYGAKITVLHVLPEEAKSNPDARSLAEPLRNEMIRLFGPSISSRCEADFVIDFGSPADTVLHHANELHADLIGLGIRRATDVVTHLRNTVAYKVILEARCPVLTQRLRNPW